MCELINTDEIVIETEFERIKINPNNFQQFPRVVAIRFINEGLDADALVAEEEDLSHFSDYDLARQNLDELFSDEVKFPFSDYLDDCKGMFLLPNKWEWNIRDSINLDKKPKTINEALRRYIPSCVVESRNLTFTSKEKSIVDERSSGNRQTSMYLYYYKGSLTDSHTDIGQYLSEIKKIARWRVLETFKYYFIFDFECGEFCYQNVSEHQEAVQETSFFRHIGLLKKGGNDIPNYNELAKDIEIKEII